MARALSIFLPEWPVWLARRKKQRQPATAESSASDRRNSANGRLSSATARPEAWLLWTAERGAQFIAHACPRAQSAGVRAGMTLAQARTLCVGLTVRDRAATPAEDAAALRRLARVLLRHAPGVMPDEPDGLLLDISGCQRLFGGEAAHVAQITALFRKWRLPVRLAVAPTFACAAAVARYGAEPITCVLPQTQRATVAALPVQALRLENAARARLADVGIEQIGELFDLSRDELVTRFGAALLTQLDRLTGVAADSIDTVQCERTFSAFYVFDGPIRRPAIVEAVTSELLKRLLSDLLAVQRGVLELTLEFRRVDLPAESIAIRLTYPNHDHAHLWKLIAPKLERLHLGFGVTEIHLHAARSERVSPHQAAFLREAGGMESHPAAWGALVDCLIDRLGKDAVALAEVHESYLPESAFRFRPAAPSPLLNRTPAVREGPLAIKPERPLPHGRGSVQSGAMPTRTAARKRRRFRKTSSRPSGSACSCGAQSLQQTELPEHAHPPPHADPSGDRVDCENAGVLGAARVGMAPRVATNRTPTVREGPLAMESRPLPHGRGSVQTNTPLTIDAPPLFNPAHRPSQMFASPEPVRVISRVPDGPPLWIDWRGSQHKIVWGSGPERIGSRWWGQRAKAQRDYYEIEDERGQRIWVYRENGSCDWFVHGRWV